MKQHLHAAHSTSALLLPAGQSPAGWWASRVILGVYSPLPMAAMG